MAPGAGGAACAGRSSPSRVLRPPARAGSSPRSPGDARSDRSPRRSIGFGRDRRCVSARPRVGGGGRARPPRLGNPRPAHLHGRPRPARPRPRFRASSALRSGPAPCPEGRLGAAGPHRVPRGAPIRAGPARALGSGRPPEGPRPKARRNRAGRAADVPTRSRPDPGGPAAVRVGERRPRGGGAPGRAAAPRGTFELAGRFGRRPGAPSARPVDRPRQPLRSQPGLAGPLR